MIIFFFHDHRLLQLVNGSWIRSDHDHKEEWWCSCHVFVITYHLHSYYVCIQCKYPPSPIISAPSILCITSEAKISLKNSLDVNKETWNEWFLSIKHYSGKYEDGVFFHTFFQKAKNRVFTLSAEKHEGVYKYITI